jgi:hypothetical protein
MNRYIPIVNTILNEIRSNMPEADEASDQDITVRLHLAKLENAILTEAIEFLAKYSASGSSSSISLIEKLQSYKKINSDVIKMIEEYKVEKSETGKSDLDMKEPFGKPPELYRGF